MDHNSQQQNTFELLDTTGSCLLSCHEILAFQRMGVYNRNGRRPELDAPVAFNMDRS